MQTPELKIDRHVARITLRRPEQHNRLEPEDLAVLAAHLATIEATPEVLVLRLEAEGRTFCSGYDLRRIGGPNTLDFEDVANAIEAARPVTLALLQGSVYGGATDLALACDFRLGVSGIEMFMPAARLGMHFYRGGLERYVSRLGIDQAKRLFLTAERIDAAEMKAIGFLTHLVERPDLTATADGLADTLAGMAPVALVGMKKHLNRIARGRLDADELQRDIERSLASSDLREGQAAWAEKRAPKFTGE